MAVPREGRQDRSKTRHDVFERTDICIYGEFGVRLEDHMVITETGARWFTQPAHSVDDPFGLDK
jgi:Xaa-Pro aminopeptidase